MYLRALEDRVRNAQFDLVAGMHCWATRILDPDHHKRMWGIDRRQYALNPVAVPRPCARLSLLSVSGSVCVVVMAPIRWHHYQPRALRNPVNHDRAASTG